jgi:hypothetical protein
MENLTSDTLHEIVDNQTGCAVTIYLPLHTSASPPHITENQIRIKNLLHKAAEQVRARGDNSDLAGALESKAEELKHDTELWKDPSPGALICASDNFLKMIRLPIDTEEYIAVEEQYHLAPVIGLQNDSREFCLLSIAQHNPKLYKGTMYGLESSNIELPPSMEEAFNIDEENMKTENQGTATGSSMNTSWFNGRGGSRNPAEHDRLLFFRAIDNIIWKSAARNLPLILAGTESITVDYRSMSKHPHLLKTIIPGNHSAVDLGTLFTQAQEIIRKELIDPEHVAVVREYQELGGANPSKVAHDIKSIARAATEGRIDKLLTRFIRKTADVAQDTLSERPRITFPDLAESTRINHIVQAAWQTSGKIFSLSPDEMPNGELAVANLRY